MNRDERSFKFKYMCFVCVYVCVYVYFVCVCSMCSSCVCVCIARKLIESFPRPSTEQKKSKVRPVASDDTLLFEREKFIYL